MKRKIFILTILILGIFLNVPAQERFVKPVDEGNQDASFTQFREKTIAALKKKDKKYLLSITDRNIKLGFGGVDGIENFKKDWKINSPNSEVWNELLAIFTNGGTFFKEAKVKNSQFCAPYIFTSFPEDLDAFEYNSIFGENVNLREKPDLNSEVIAQLSYNVVKVDFEKSVKNAKNGETFEWYKIKTLGGKEGFVSAEFVRSPIGYRSCFEKQKGKWKMTAFLAGD